MRRALRDNGLSIVLVSLFLIFWVGQSIVGHREYNSEQRDHQQPEVGYVSYLRSAHFWEATAENWESEFFQMFGYVVLTALLYQVGSAESKRPDEREPVDRDPRKRKTTECALAGAPRWIRALASTRIRSRSPSFCSSSISITLHAVAGSRVYNEDQANHGAAGTI